MSVARAKAFIDLVRKEDEEGLPYFQADWLVDLYVSHCASIRESERAACEAIASPFSYCNAGAIITARIAARNGKGEGRSDVLAEEPSDDGAGDRA